MTNAVPALLGASICLLYGAATWAQPPSLGEVDGAWEGSVVVIGTNYEDPLGRFAAGDEFELRIEVSADAARVFALLSEWHELRVRRVVRSGPSAMVIADALSERAAETWALNVTKRDNTSILVAITRSIRPLRVADETAQAFAMQAVGELQENESERQDDAVR